MKKSDMTRVLRKDLRSVRVSPALRQRTIDAVQGKESVYMKKKISTAFVFALVAVLLCAAALAAANRVGMLDFVNRYSGAHYLPADAQDYIETDVAVMENDWVSVAVRELYYDGRVSRLTLDVTPRQPKTLILGEDIFLEDPFINLTHDYVMDGENDMRSVYQVIKEEGYEQVYAASVFMQGAVDDMVMGTGDYVLGEDGTLTIYSQEEYKTDMPEREVTIRAVIMPFDQPLTLESRANWERGETLETPITLTASVNLADAQLGEEEVANVYVNDAPAEFPSVGVRVDELRIEMKPQELYAIIEYTVIDREAYDAQEGGLWFEFIDPESAAETPVDQRLMAGLTGGGSAGALDGDSDTATRFCQRETLGRNELHETYTLRAFNAWGKERYETQTLCMRPVTEENIK